MRSFHFSLKPLKIEKIMRSTLATLTKQTMGRVRRRTLGWRYERKADDRDRDGPHGRDRQSQGPQQGGASEGGRRVGRPGKVNRKVLATLKRLLATGTTQAECAETLGVSVRTIGRAVSRMRL